MALINCPECQKEISEEATTCPHCGKPLPPAPIPAESEYPKGKCGLFILIPILLILIIALLGNCSGPSIDYEIVSTSTYVNNSEQAKSYRVVVARDATEEDLKEVFEDITASDGYKYHTVWFYSTESKATGGDTYDIAMIEDDDGFVWYRHK